MDANYVISQLTGTWTSMLEQFYDTISDEVIVWLAKEHNLDLNELREKAKPLRTKILAKGTSGLETKKTTKKSVPRAKEPNQSKYGNYSCNELKELCKERRMPTRRSKADMINDLMKNDAENNNEENEKKEEESENDEEKSENEKEESDKKEKGKELKKVNEKKKEKQVVIKKPESSKPSCSKNELFEESLSEDEDED